MDSELIIIALYLNVQGQTRSQAEKHVYETKDYIDDIFGGVHQTIKTIVIPSHDVDTRIECIYPNNKKSIDNGVINSIYEELLKDKYDTVSYNNINNIIRKVKIERLLKKSS